MLTLKFSDGGHIPEEIPETGDTGVVQPWPDGNSLSRVVSSSVEVPAAGPAHQGGHCSLGKLVDCQVRLGLAHLQLVSPEVGPAVQSQVTSGTVNTGWRHGKVWPSGRC